MSAYVVIDDYLPVLVVRRVGAADVEGVTGMLSWVHGHLARARGKVGFVYDAGTSAGGLPDAAARRAGGEWIAARRSLMRDKVEGLDFAFPSPLSRGALTAVFWIAQPPVPWTMHGSLKEAVTSALARTGAPHTASSMLEGLRVRASIPAPRS